MTDFLSVDELIPGRSYLYAGDWSDISEITSLFGPIDSVVSRANEIDVHSARQLVAQAQLGAFTSKRLFLITSADEMTEAVQNTLLKLLEDPPPTAVLLLQTRQPQKLLPTVLSRLHSLSGGESVTAVQQSIFDGPPTSIFKKLTEMDRETLVKLLSQELNYQRVQLLTNPNQKTTNRVERLNLAVDKLKKNANQKLTIDWLLLHFEDN